MDVIKRSTSGYSQDPTKYFNFSRYKKRCGDFTLIEGAFEESTLWKQFDFTESELEELLKKKIVRLEFEEPNKFFIGDNPDNYDHQFYKIFTLCPFTSEWLNKKHHNKKRVPIFFPFNEQFIPKKEKKKYDVIYTGHIVSGTIMNYINIISKFKYRFISNSDHKLVTNRGASYEDKMKFISQSKMTIVSNLLYPKAYHIFNIWRIADFYKNEAFKFIPGRGQIWKLLNTKNVIVPQLKSRVFEAAFGRSLILCRRDPFKVIERYFTPNEDFIYFDDDNLEEKIKEVLKDYPKYERMIDNAYKKALANYTTKKFVENYLEKM